MARDVRQLWGHGTVRCDAPRRAAHRSDHNGLRVCADGAVPSACANGVECFLDFGVLVRDVRLLIESENNHGVVSWESGGVGGSADR